MRKQVAQANDLALGHCGQSILPVFGQSSSSLAQDEQLPLDGSALLVVRNETLERHALRVPQHRFAGSNDVGNVEQQVTRHEQGPFRSTGAAEVLAP